MAMAYVDENSFAHDIASINGCSRIGKHYYGSCDWNAVKVAKMWCHLV